MSALAPKRPEHADYEKDLGDGFVLKRRLVGYGTNPAVNTTPQYRYELYLDGRFVDEDRHYHPLRWRAKRSRFA